MDPKAMRLRACTRDSTGVSRVVDARGGRASDFQLPAAASSDQRSYERLRFLATAFPSVRVRGIRAAR
jgi:hypothetical protein